MNVLIAADMEGIAGIERSGECLPAYPSAYARGRRLMTDEILVAVEALRKGGVERIAVGDWHMVGTNVERERMPAGVEVRPIADLALTEAESSMAKANGGPLDAVVMIGHHASTPNPRAFCSHTFIWEMEVLLGGDSLSEVQVYAQALAAEGVPVLAVAGDRWMLEELGEEIASATVTGPDELLGAIATAFRASQVSREYRQLAKLLPAGHDSRTRALQRRLGSLIATPVMRSKERRWLAAAPRAID
ncbi:MAG TPA: M55 family metallopeptidase [Solirubrobacterales bacterium]